MRRKRGQRARFRMNECQLMAEAMAARAAEPATERATERVRKQVTAGVPSHDR